MCMRICYYLHRNLHKDLLLFAQKRAGGFAKFTVYTEVSKLLRSRTNQDFMLWIVIRTKFCCRLKKYGIYSDKT